MMDKKIKGRAAGFNPANRFEELHIDDTEFAEDVFPGEEHEAKQIKTIYYKDSSKSVISKNESSDLGFNLSVNPYRGCEHGCIYCYARPTHEYLGFSSGIDFESKIMIKEDAPRLLEEVFKKKSYNPDVIMLSGNTDPYQPLERRLKITRKLLEVCLHYKNPVSVITKNSLIRRDADLLKELSLLNLVSVMISVTSLNPELTRVMEPRTSTPERRLETIEILTQAGIPVGVNLAPVIPGLNDEEIPAIIKESASRGAEYASYILLRLPYAVKDLFLDWLGKEFPERANKIINKIKSTRNGKLNESGFGVRFTGKGEIAETIRNLFYLSCGKHGLKKTGPHLNLNKFSGSANDQMELF